jgi:hypothetical protein
MTFIKYAKNKLYIRGEEANPLIEYVRKRIKADEYLYSFVFTNFVLQFKNGYGVKRISNVSKDNIIYGRVVWTNDNGRKEEVNKIVEAKKVYILFSHAREERIYKFIEDLREQGNLKEVKRVYGTKLYYFTAKNPL